MKKHPIRAFIENPKKGLLRLSLPIMVGMIVQTLYSIVDTAYIGRLGAESLAALTLAFPIFFILISINSGIGIGANSRISRYLGEKNKKAAENTAMHGILISIVFAVITIALGWFSIPALFNLFGAEPAVTALGIQYMLIVLLGVIVMFPTFAMANILSSQGDTKSPMKMQLVCLVANIILDPIFIFSLNMGVAGAAIATIIAMSLGLIISIYYIKKKSYLKLSFRTFKFSSKVIKEILEVGFPGTVMMLLLSLSFMILNSFMTHFGTEYVASFGIISRIESLITLPMIAISMAMVTLIGLFFGAKREDLIEEISWYGIKVAAVFTVVSGIFLFLFPYLFVQVFTPEQQIIDIASLYLRISVFALPFVAISMIASRIMQGLGLGLPGLIINLVRTLIITVPLAYILVFMLGLNYVSIAIAIVAGSIAANIVAFILLKKRFAEMKKHKIKINKQKKNSVLVIKN